MVSSRFCMTICSLLLCTCIIKINAKPYVVGTCKAEYSDGSLEKPCGLCHVCRKQWDQDNRITVNKCDSVMHYLWSLSTRKPPLSVFSTGADEWCSTFNSCSGRQAKKLCRCETYAREGSKNKKVCINLFGICKCGCDETRYGQMCEYIIPPGHSSNSFADIQNIVYKPYVYSTEFMTIAIYFYSTGINVNVEVQTERELLLYDNDSCKTDIIPLDNYCVKLFEEANVAEYSSACKGQSTYENPEYNEICGMTVNIAFPRVQIYPGKEKYFIRDYIEEPDFLNRTIIAKIEIINIRVNNKILVDPKNETIFSNVFGAVVIYVGKTHLEDCPPLIKIHKYGKTMFNLPSFPRRKEIFLSSSVVLSESAHCENLGDPILNWFVWIVKLNHDEKHDPPLNQQFRTANLLLPSYSLDFGLYKVKHEVRFVERRFNRESTYCYFKIVPLLLQPIIVGGSLRYIYYISTLELITAPIIDQNFPWNQQPRMKYSWYCNDTDYFCHKLTTENLILPIVGPFKPGKVYNFTMEIISSSSLEYNNQIIIVSPDPIPDLLIECLWNCGGKNFKSDTREILYFRVKHSQFSAKVEESSLYNWAYFTSESTDFNIEEIRQHEETPSSILIINENSLVNGKIYTFKVSGGGKPQGEAQIEIQTFELSDTFKCNINPKTGIAGETKFSVACFIAESEKTQFSLTFTFYDKYNKDELTGRLLGSSYVESIEDIILSRGTVVVYAINMNRNFWKTYVTVDLSHPTVTPDFLKENINVLKKMSESQDYEKKISFISCLCDILNSNVSLKQEAVEIFLDTIRKEKAIGVLDMELLLLTTQAVICQRDNCTTATMTQTSYKYLSHILLEISTQLSSELVKDSQINSEMTSFKVQLLYNSLLKCAGILLTVYDEMLINKIYKNIGYNIYELYKFGSLETIKSLHKVNMGLAIRNLPFIKQSITETEYIETWMKEDAATFFVKGTKKEYIASFIRISPQLASILTKISQSIILQTMNFKHDPYWWSLTDQVMTEVISLNIGYTIGYQNYTSIKSFVYPVDIFLKKKVEKYTTVTGKVIQPDPEDDHNINDLLIAVHKIYPPKGAKISIKFIEMDTTDAFRVCLMINQRPDYDYLSYYAVNITRLSPWYNLSQEVNHNDDIVFIGILPGSNVSIRNTVHYKFELRSSRCQVWYDVLWTTTGCNVGSESTKEYLHCQCNHLSSIAGFLGAPINTVNPFTDYKLFLTVPDNPFVFAFISSICLLFIILLIWSVKTDRQDDLKKTLIVLEDNISSDQFGYLLIVFTGLRLFAGTSSNIGIILHGSNASSRSHILRTPIRSTLQRNNDDWFLIFTPKHLGEMSSIHLWTDHSGANPNWFCDKIHIHDLSSKEDYIFILGKWFGVTQMGIRVESFARPIKLDKTEHYVEFFLTNTIFGFRESHLWFSIASRHPRSPISRSQRLSMAMVAVVVILLASIMFYDTITPQEEDFSSYSVGYQELLISVYSLIISAGITAIVYFAFRKSYHYEKDKRRPKRSEAHLTTEDTKIHADKVDTLKELDKSDHNFKYYFTKAILLLRKEHFYPVQTKRDSVTKNVIVVHKIRVTLAWILCISIILITCFFIVLYGLKLGKIKSLLWLTSIGMTIGEDVFVADPTKIFLISLLFGLVQTQICNIYTYDQNIYETSKKIIKRYLPRDRFIHQLRLQNLYKPISEIRLKTIRKQQIKIQSWWAFVDIFDICFLIVAIFLVILQSVLGDYNIDSLFTKMLFKNVNLGKNFDGSPQIRNVSSYSQYLQNTILPRIYLTNWYNNQPLTIETEIFGETGWTLDSTHRIMGVPRLRQIRTKRQVCNIPFIVQNLSFYCNVLFSSSTEDTDDYGSQWKEFPWDDVLFSRSPWNYLSAEESSSINIYTESGKLIHGGGYIAELKRIQRKSADTLWKLLNVGWLDMRTYVVFFEMSMYNVNDNVFTSIIFITEHLETMSVLSDKRIWSVFIRKENIVYEVVCFVYFILGLTKLLMFFNTVGVRLFFCSFWPMYDLSLITAVTCYFVGYRILLQFTSQYVNYFQKSGKDTYFQFQKLIFYVHLQRILLGMLFVLTTARSLRLLKYGTRIISKKQKYTMYFSWSKILWITLVFCIFMFSLQRLVAYLVNRLYHFGISHLMLYKMNYLHLCNSAISPEKTFFIFLSCFTSYLAMFFFIIILINSYSLANITYTKEETK